MPKRSVDVVVLSDIHLGTYGCHATELLQYLRSISPRLLVLNGDIVDIWNFSKRYFPASHTEVISEIMLMATSGTRVVYITGNHDELLRRYGAVQLGNLQITDKMLVEIDGKKHWIFHGDVFDHTTKGWARILAKLGGKGYDLLILFNRLVNWVARLLGRENLSLSKRIKQSVKKAVAWISDFEQTAAELAIDKGYDYVICCNIHQPQLRQVSKAKCSELYKKIEKWFKRNCKWTLGREHWTIYHHLEQPTPQHMPASKPIKRSLPQVEVEQVMLYIHSLTV